MPRDRRPFPKTSGDPLLYINIKYVDTYPRRVESVCLMYNLAYKLNYISNFLSKNDRNGLTVWKDYLSGCLSFDDQIELVTNFENDLENQAKNGCEFSKLYFDSLVDDDDFRQEDTKA
jgi:hypothetical protein